MELEMIIVILILAVLLLCGCFFYLYYMKKKAKAYEEELKREIKFENKLKKEESEPLKEIESQVKTSHSQMDIAAMLDQMAADLEGQAKDKTVDFEQEQEETSIISYKELKKAVETFTEDEEMAQEQSPISVKEVLNLRREEKEEDPILQLINQNSEAKAVEEVKEKEVHPVLQEKKKFQNTEFISPIYGKQEQKVEYPHIPVMEDTEEVLSVLEKNQDTETKEEAFLNELRDFRKQL